MYTYSLEKIMFKFYPALPLLNAEELVGGALLSPPTIGSAGRTCDGHPPLVLTDDTPRLARCALDLCLVSNSSESGCLIAGLADAAIHVAVS
jgi:hypothetical protein